MSEQPGFNQPPEMPGLPEVPGQPAARNEYHRLLRQTKNYRWWKPLIFALLAVVFGFTFTQILVMLAAIPLVFEGNVSAIFDLQDRLVKLDTQDPFALGIALSSLAVWIPAIILAAWAMGFTPVGRLWSIALKIRWSLIFRTLGPALLALLLAQLLGILYVQATFSGDEVVDAVADFDTKKALISLLLIIILVPLQATAEELMFRGAFMQVLGSWIKSPIPVIIIPAIAFAFGHLYDPWGLVQVGVMGLIAGWLTWRTGGLEAAISLHIVNNFMAFAFLLTGFAGDTAQQQETGSDAVLVLIQVLSFVFYAYMVLRVYKKREVFFAATA